MATVSTQSSNFLAGTHACGKADATKKLWDLDAKENLVEETLKTGPYGNWHSSKETNLLARGQHTLAIWYPLN